MDHKKYITEKGTIHYWVNICSPEKKWIVFLPGLTADHSLFDSQVECFSKKYNMFVWDAPAHGLSRPFELSFSMQDIVHYLYTIFQIEHIVMPIFVGQSLGGYIAQVYITEYPNTTLGFISVDSCPMSRRYYSWWELALMRHTKGMYMSIPWKLLLKWGINGTSETSYGRQVMKNAWSVYTKEEYCSLADYLEDGRLELSNNRAERSMKPFVMGRKNWLFANTPGGAQASSVIYSLIETAKENGLDPYRYLLWLLQNAPQLSKTDEAWAESLLPANAPEECYIPHK